MSENLMNKEKATILIVDDEEKNRRIFTKWLEAEDYECCSASSGKSALSLIQTIDPDVILLDLMMPDMDGFQVASQLKNDPETSEIPIIIVTALDDKRSLIRALSNGAEEFLNKPIDTNELQIRVRNMIRLKRANDILKNHKEELNIKVGERTKEVQESLVNTVGILGKVAEYRDDETGAHVQRISYYTHALCQTLEKDHDYCNLMFHASSLHDIGKIGIPDHILFKEGPLDEDEWKIMRKHPEIGGHMLSLSDAPLIRMGREIAECHHERWDGSGYPKGLSQHDIPLAARIMCICDVYDALRSKRPYKRPFTHQVSMNIILNGDGRTDPKHFDPMVRAAFKQCGDEFERIFQEHALENEV